MNDFEALWRDLQRRLRPGLEIKGWSRDKGDTSLRFEIVDVSPGSITVTSPTLSKSRTISKGDFARVYAAWPDYRSAKISRAEMADMSQNTSYIFGVLQWRDS
jgi:hypothetical protein